MIQIAGLIKKFDSKVAVNIDTMNVPKGVVYGFIGPNGAGKTTTLKMIMGLMQPTVGKIMINDTNISQNPLYAKTIAGFLPDEIFLYDYLSGYQFLEFLADIHKLPKDKKQERIDYLVELFDLNDFVHDYSTNYSFGMKKRLALAGIVIHEPTLLILDEPFNGLDPQAIKDFRDYLNKVAKQGTTVIFSSHVLEVVERIATHIGLISSGTIKISTDFNTLLSKYNSLENAFFELINR